MLTKTSASLTKGSFQQRFFKKALYGPDIVYRLKTKLRNFRTMNVTSPELASDPRLQQHHLAAAAGSRREDCEEKFPDCKILNREVEEILRILL